VYETAYPFDVIDDVRRKQLDGAPGEAIAVHLVAESIDPPHGRGAWDAALVAEVFGVA
jgi:hypothetical protein